MTDSAEWNDVQISLLAALQELVTTFPVDYYPTRCSADKAKLQQYKSAVQKLEVAWMGHVANVRGHQVHNRQLQQNAGAGAVDVHREATNTKGSNLALVPDDVDKEVQGLQFSSCAALCVGPATAALAQLQKASTLKSLEVLSQRLEQLSSIASMVSAGIVRFKCF